MAATETTDKIDPYGRLWKGFYVICPECNFPNEHEFGHCAECDSHLSHHVHAMRDAIRLCVTCAGLSENCINRCPACRRLIAAMPK